MTDNYDNDAAIRRIRQTLLQRGQDVAPPVPQSDGTGSFTMVEPEELYRQQGSNAVVLADDGAGGAERVGVQEYAVSGRAPLNPSTLRQDWGDAKTGNDTSSLDNTVRGVGDKFYERGTDGVDYPITYNEVDQVTETQDFNSDGVPDQLGKTLLNDEETKTSLKRAMIERLYEDRDAENTDLYYGPKQEHEMPSVDPRLRRLERFSSLTKKEEE